MGPRDEHGSPYASESVFAGDVSLLDAEALVQDGLIDADQARSLHGNPAVLPGLLSRMLRRFMACATPALRRDFSAYLDREAYWLDDYALYRCLHDVLRAPWFDWPQALRDRDAQALARARDQHVEAVQAQRFGQFLFDRQWQALRAYAREQGILMFGDVPFFVAHDSADVWAHRARFRLDAAGAMLVETGVPPDYFSEHGQLWRTPHYDWDTLRQSGYRWWLQRMQRQGELFDIVRIDHFRGLAAAWEVPAGQATAVNGRWAPGPGLELLEMLRARVPTLSLAAEDLGFITEDVRQLLRAAGLPGMRVLQFGFDGQADNPHLPANCDASEIFYTGTHDNDTLMGWFDSLDDNSRQRVRERLALAAEEPFCAAARQCVLDAPAVLAMLPMQDLLCLGTEARMNTPGTTGGNWSWRLDALPPPGQAATLRQILRGCGRL